MNPGSPAPQAGILDQARRLPHFTVQLSFKAKIINALIKFNSSIAPEGILKHGVKGLKFL